MIQKARPPARLPAAFTASCLLLVGCFLGGPSACTHAAPSRAPATDVEFFAPTSGRSAPYSEAVRVGDLLFLAGKLGTRPGGRGLAPGGIQPETKQALENIQQVLERHGATMDQVVKCTVFLADIAEWAAMNEVYVTFFPSNRPARSAVGVGGLARGARVEIECMASVTAAP